MAVSTGIAVLSIIGLVVGLVVLLVVISLLTNTLKPLLAVKRDVNNALTAPMLKSGVPGTDQLGTTRRLADGVPDLAVRYLAKLGVTANTAPPAGGYNAPPAATPASAPGAAAGWTPPWRR